MLALQLAAHAACGARLRVWAAPCTAEEHTRRSGPVALWPSGSVYGAADQLAPRSLIPPPHPAAFEHLGASAGAQGAAPVEYRPSGLGLGVRARARAGARAGARVRVRVRPAGSATARPPHMQPPLARPLGICTPPSSALWAALIATRGLAPTPAHAKAWAPALPPRNVLLVLLVDLTLTLTLTLTLELPLTLTLELILELTLELTLTLTLTQGPGRAARRPERRVRLLPPPRAP